MKARRTALPLLATLVLSAGLLAGLGTGAASAGHTGTGTATTETSATASTTVPEPVVTTVVRTTPAGKVLPGTGKPAVHLGDMSNPEQLIIGRLYEAALEYEGYRVDPDRDIGTPSQRILGLTSGKLDIYPEYLAEWNSRFAHLHHRYQTLRAAYAAGARYARRHGFELLPPTPFSDTYCVAVLAQYAAQNHVYSIPQLARQRRITFGAPITFQEIADGLPALRSAYHLHARVKTTLITPQYAWLRNGRAAYCATTDPQLDGTKFVQLRDPKHVFGHGNVVPVTTPQVLKLEGRVFRLTIEHIDSLLTLRAMRGLNAEYEFGGQGLKAIAEQFLEGNGILPRSRYAPVPTSTSPSGSTVPQG